MRTHRALLAILVLLLGSIACGLQDRSGDTPPIADTPSPEPQVASPVSLDLCTLLTAIEVSDALGEAVEVKPGVQTGACSYATTSSPQSKSVAVSAAQGSQARDLVQMSASLGLLFGGNADLQRIADDLQANAASMSFCKRWSRSPTPSWFRWAMHSPLQGRRTCRPSGAGTRWGQARFNGSMVRRIWQ